LRRGYCFFSPAAPIIFGGALQGDGTDEGVDRDLRALLAGYDEEPVGLGRCPTPPAAASAPVTRLTWSAALGAADVDYRAERWTSGSSTVTVSVAGPAAVRCASEVQPKDEALLGPVRAEEIRGGRAGGNSSGSGGLVASGRRLPLSPARSRCWCGGRNRGRGRFEVDFGAQDRRTSSSRSAGANLVGAAATPTDIVPRRMTKPKRRQAGGYNVFISWAKARSQSPASAFAEFLGTVVQYAKPWISTEDIPKGSAWFSKISDALEGCNVGVVFVTRENMLEPWIHLEAGAILKAVSDEARVCPVLLDLPVTDLAGPFSNLNATTTEKADMQKLILDINRAIGSDVPETRLRSAFDAQWPALEKALKVPPPVKPEKHREDRELLEEILVRVRSMQSDQPAKDVPLWRREPDGSIRYWYTGSAEAAQANLARALGMEVPPGFPDSVVLSRWGTPNAQAISFPTERWGEADDEEKEKK
jgi:hypothetical protein